SSNRPARSNARASVKCRFMRAILMANVIASGPANANARLGLSRSFVVKGPGDDLLSHGQSAISSARRRFTVLFGMGRGGANALWSPGILECRRYWVMHCVARWCAHNLQGYRVNTHGQLVSVSSKGCPSCTPDLSTSSSPTTLQGGR